MNPVHYYCTLRHLGTLQIWNLRVSWIHSGQNSYYFLFFFTMLFVTFLKEQAFSAFIHYLGDF